MTSALHFRRPADAKPAPSLFARLLAWWRPRPAYKMAPPLGPRAGYLGLHIGHTSSSRSALR